MDHLIYRTSPLHLLILEEVPAERALFADCAKAIHAEAIFAHTGMEAVAIFRTQPIDATLLNLDIGSDDGFEALNRIRVSGRQGHGAPVIAMTEQFTGLPESAYKRLGFNGLYVKPIEPFRLAGVIDAAFIATGHNPLFKMRARA